MQTRTIIAPRAAETWLVVDDFSPLRHLLGHWLRHTGTPAQCAAHGGEAWELLARQRWAGLITDCAMPVLDGLALIRRVRRAPHLAGLPILLVSAETGADFLARALDAGADAVLGKPCARMHLLAAVRTAQGTKIPAGKNPAHA